MFRPKLFLVASAAVMLAILFYFSSNTSNACWDPTICGSSAQPAPTQPPPAAATPTPSVGSFTAPLPGGGTHIVQAGQNLGKIAEMYNVSLGAILQANPLITNPNVIKVGDVIIIPSGNGGVVVQNPQHGVATATPNWVQIPAGVKYYDWGYVNLTQAISPSDMLVMAPVAVAEPTPIGELVIMAGGISYFHYLWVSSDAPAMLEGAVSGMWDSISWMGQNRKAEILASEASDSGYQEEGQVSQQAWEESVPYTYQAPPPVDPCYVLQQALELALGRTLKPGANMITPWSAAHSHPVYGTVLELMQLMNTCSMYQLSVDTLPNGQQVWRLYWYH